MGLYWLNMGYYFQVCEGGVFFIWMTVVAKIVKHILVHNLGCKQPMETIIVPFETTRRDLSNGSGFGAIGYQH